MQTNTRVGDCSLYCVYVIDYKMKTIMINRLNKGGMAEKGRCR